MARLTNKKPSVEDARKLTGPEKAAVILLSLGEDHTRLWQGLDEEEIKEISQAMATLGTVSSQVVEELLIEFVSGMTGSGSSSSSSGRNDAFDGAAGWASAAHSAQVVSGRGDGRGGRQTWR